MNTEETWFKTLEKNNSEEIQLFVLRHQNSPDFKEMASFIFLLKTYRNGLLNSTGKLGKYQVTKFQFNQLQGGLEFF